MMDNADCGSLMKLFFRFLVILALTLGSAVAQQETPTSLAASARTGNNVALQELKAQASAGNASAQFNLGLMYASGEGVPKDFVIAYMWRNLASAQGEGIAKPARDALETMMTPAQIAEAQKLSREWKPKK